MKIKVTDDTSVSLAENDDITTAVATRKASIDYTSALYFLPNPDATLKRRGQDITIYNELSTDPLVSAAVGSFKDGVKELKWEIDRGKAKSRSAQLIERVFNDIDGTDEMGGLQRIIGEILDARMFGYQPCEIMWEKVGRYVVPVDIVAKPQNWFAFTPENELLFRSKTNPTGEPVTPYKFICPTFEGKYDNPYGRAILSSCFWPVTFKKAGFKFLVTFVEKYGMPWVKGTHNSNDQEKIDQFAEDIESMIQDGVIVLKKDEEDITFEHGNSTASSEIYGGLIALCREEINYAILNHNSGTSATPGKLGNENGALEARSSVIRAGKSLVEQALNVVIKWTYQVNGLTGAVPRFEMYSEEDVDNDNAERDEKLHGNGVRFTRAYMRKTYGLEDEDFYLPDNGETKPPSTEPEPAPINLPTWIQDVIRKTIKQPESFAEDDMPDDQQSVEDAVDKLIAPGKNKVAQKFVDTVIDLIEQSDSFEDAIKRISKAFPKMPLIELEEQLERFMSVAAIVGAHTDIEEGE